MNFRGFFLAKGSDVDSEEAAMLFNNLVEYSRNFRKEEFRAWYAEKRRRREVREKRRQQMEASYPWEDRYYFEFLMAQSAGMMQDCEQEAELLGLRLVVKEGWSSESKLIIPRHPSDHNYSAGTMIVYTGLWPHLSQ